MTNTDIKERLRQIIQELLPKHDGTSDTPQHFDASPLPSKEAIHALIGKMLELLFPGYHGSGSIGFDNLELRLSLVAAEVFEELGREVLREAQHACKRPNPDCEHCRRYARDVPLALLEALPAIRKVLDDDVRAAMRNDPAATSFDEIIFSYPCIEAIAIHRLANVLHHQGLTLIPRIMSEWAHSRTGIDIHPAATIGPGFFIDHGTGVVIGETTTIGTNVTLYQGVTLGALNFPRDAQGNVIRRAKRHPSIEDDVVIYAGATILGGDTVIGKGAVIGGNTWLTSSVPPQTRVLLGKPDLRIIPPKGAGEGTPSTPP